MASTHDEVTKFPPDRPFVPALADDPAGADDTAAASPGGGDEQPAGGADAGEP